MFLVESSRWEGGDLGGLKACPPGLAWDLTVRMEGDGGSVRLLKMKEVTCSPAPLGIRIAPFTENSYLLQNTSGGRGSLSQLSSMTSEGKGESWLKGMMLTSPGPGST